MRQNKKQTKIYIVEMFDKNITGFTTYKKELFHCLKIIGNAVPHIISLRCPTHDFKIKTDDDVITYLCPGKHNEIIEVSCALLALYIEDHKNNIFLFNFSPSSRWLETFRKYFPNGKMVYVIHDFMWASFLLGDISKFYKMINNRQVDKYSMLVKSIYQDGKETFKLADKIVCLSEDSLCLLQNAYHIPIDKLVKIHNGLRNCSYHNLISKEQKLKRFKHLVNPKILLFAGRISVQKGAMDLINSFSTVVKLFPNTLLVMVGEYESAFLQHINNEIRDNLVLLGGLPHEELYYWYKIADWGIIPSYYEQCSYTGIEMKMFGLPIISSNGLGVRNMFNSQNSINADIGEINTPSYQRELTNAIIKALSLPESQIEKFRLSSKEDFRKRYTISIMAEGYCSLLHEISK